jgi:hypothetical protein
VLKEKWGTRAPERIVVLWALDTRVSEAQSLNLGVLKRAVSVGSIRNVHLMSPARSSGKSSDPDLDNAPRRSFRTWAAFADFGAWGV